MPRTPPHESQARFFVQLQHLLTAGEFVSTYKFALLLALTRWAVENPDHDEKVPLRVDALAEHFVSIYWPQVRPFAVAEPSRGQPAASAVAEPTPVYGLGASWSSILVQDRGGQRPRVLRRILDEMQAGADRVHDLPDERRRRLLQEVAQHIRTMPLWKLHNTTDGSTTPFLYRRGPDDHHLVFEPGIVACLNGFAMLIEEVVRSAWLRFVLRCNPRLVGTPAASLEQFLFPAERGGLAPWRRVLEPLQAGRCFYCQQPMRKVVVDHFLPWSRYPRDLGPNFVLAHAECNQKKQDHLASAVHLARWVERNDQHHERLAHAVLVARLPHDWPTLRRVAASLYHVASQSGARVWQGGRELVELDARWRSVLGVA
ncbi:MAG: HNH endonuclease [Planctomycetes bacterium]|nr:HNH endonuclease [Planctomycetota bacterium]